jgi:hypothetical protein
VPRGVEKAKRDAAVDPAAQQHRHPQRRPARGCAPHKMILGDPNCPERAGRGDGERR